MATEVFANGAKASLQTTLTATDATPMTISYMVIDGTFPTPGGGNQFHILIDTEIMLVTAAPAAGQWTVTRAYGGTQEAAHAINANIFTVVDADVLRSFVQSPVATSEMLGGSTVGQVLLTTTANQYPTYGLLQPGSFNTTAPGSNVFPQWSGTAWVWSTIGSNFVQLSPAAAQTGNISVTGNTSSAQLISTVATGTAPLTVTSTTLVANLNAAQLGGLGAGSFVQLSPATNQTGNISITGNISASGNVTTGQLVSNDATGTPPLAVTSTTLVANLNVAQVGGIGAAGLVQLSPAAAQTGNLSITGNAQASTITSTVAAGTAPLTVTSTTEVTNLNANLVGGLAPLASNAVSNYIQILIENVASIAVSTTATTIPDVPSNTITLLTLASSTSLTFPAPVAGKSFLLASLQNATGGFTLTWPAIKWPNAAAPSQTTAASKMDTYSFICIDGTNWVGYVTGQNI